MRTTLSIPDELLEAAKQQAHARGQTLGRLVEAALRRELAVAEESVDRPPVPIFLEGNGPRAGVDLTSNRALHELLDEELDLDSRR